MQEEILTNMPEQINNTIRDKALSPQVVIEAAEKLCRAVRAGEFDRRLKELNAEGLKRGAELAASLLSREYMEFKLETELGENYANTVRTRDIAGRSGISARRVPLGVLLHIAAGNADGLPALTLAEGLLSGNVNIIKLPRADKGLSIELSQRLIELAPELSDFIYIFDTPSSDLATLSRLADMADGIVVWGGDEAVTAARRMASPQTKLIEWGHKLGFAYISGFEDKDAELRALAQHISSTKQLLCSSCQTIFIDTDNMSEIHTFCREFLPYLEQAAANNPPESVGAAAGIALRRYNARIERIIANGAAPEGEYQGQGCLLTTKEDSELELSGLFCDCAVKRLPRDQMLAVLRRKKGYLQTAGLICRKEDRSALADRLARAGVCRVTRAGDLSETFCGEAHDGEYPLLRYTRIVNIQD